MRVPTLLSLAIGLTAAACAPTLVVQKTVDPSRTSASVESAPPATPTLSSNGDDGGPSLSVAYPLSPEVARIQILVDKHSSRSAEMIAVFDFHTDATSADKGFDQLRLAASRVGADAVIGAEFEHGDEGAKSHLSGTAVRFLDR